MRPFLLSVLFAVSRASTITGPLVPGGSFDFNCVHHTVYSREEVFPVTAPVYTFFNDSAGTDCVYGPPEGALTGKIVLINDWMMQYGYCTWLINMQSSYGGVASPGHNGMNYELARNLQDLGAVGIASFIQDVDRNANKNAFAGDDRTVDIPMCYMGIDPCDVFELSPDPPGMPCGMGTINKQNFQTLPGPMIDCGCWFKDPDSFLWNITVGRYLQNHFGWATVPGWYVDAVPNDGSMTVTLTAHKSPWTGQINSTGNQVFLRIWGVVNVVLAVCAMVCLVKLIQKRPSDYIFMVFCIVAEGLVASIIRALRNLTFQPAYYHPGVQYYYELVLSLIDFPITMAASAVTAYVWLKLAFSSVVSRCGHKPVFVLDISALSVGVALLSWGIWRGNVTAICSTYGGSENSPGEGLCPLSRADANYSFESLAAMSYVSLGLLAAGFLRAVCVIVSSAKSASNDSMIQLVKRWSVMVFFQIIFATGASIFTYFRQYYVVAGFYRDYTYSDCDNFWGYGCWGVSFQILALHCIEIFSFINGFAQVYMFWLRVAPSSSSSSSTSAGSGAATTTPENAQAEDTPQLNPQKPPPPADQTSE